MAVAKSGTQRLQEIFASYDTSGDGTLSVEEMQEVFEQLGIRGSAYLFKQIDKNKDGQLQVHEFISWLTKKDPKCSVTENVSGGSGNIVATVTNTNTKVPQKVSFTFSNCQNVDFTEGKSISFILQPGEQMSQPLLTVTGEPYNYKYNVVVRSEYLGLPSDPNAWIDPDFPHDMTSIKGHTKEIAHDVWVQARLLGNPEDAKLFDEVRPKDVKQGALGDCWLMAAMAQMASHPEHLKKLFSSKHLTEDGRQQVWLYDAGPHEWTQVAIDEFLPCKLQNEKPVPLFAKPLGEELWAPLLEKAFAKFCYSYGKLWGGGAWYAFQCMTGAKTMVNWQWNKKAEAWKPKYLKEDWAKEKSENCRGKKSNYTSWNFKNVTKSSEDLWQILIQHGTKDYLMACSCEGANPEAKGKGIVLWHLYSLLHVIEEVTDDGSKVRLVQVRNPWAYRDWTGDWWDQSSQWKENPMLSERMAPLMTGGGNDGKFFLCWEDFVKCFNVVTICPLGSRVLDVEGEDEEPEGAEEPEEDDSRNFVSSDIES